MFSAGVNIKSQDALKKVTLEYIYNSIKNPKPDILATITQLRTIKSLDKTLYRERKTLLPFFVCGVFNPPYRKIQNFGYTEYFVVDIDHINEKGLNINELKKSICCDQRVLLCFVSPGQEGLKVLFKLCEKCYDAGLYSLFYRSFVKKLSLEYNLEQVLDSSTCDASRACFISYDPELYYNPNAEMIDINSHINLENDDSIFEAKSTKETNLEEEKKSQDLAADIMTKIRQTLGAKVNCQRDKTYYVPEELNEIMDSLSHYLIEHNVEINKISNISYGKKLQLRLGLKQAEINLFYGKKGFSVVISPRSGTSKELNELMKELITTFIIENT